MTLTRKGARVLVALSTFVLLTIAFAVCSRSWVTWYQLARFGQATQASVILALSELHEGCSFTYGTGGNTFGYGSESGCADKIGQQVPAIYLPYGSNVVTLKEPGIQWMRQLGVIVILSLLAGAGGGMYATRKGQVVGADVVLAQFNPPWSRIALAASAGAFAWLVIGVEGLYFLGDRWGSLLLFCAPILAAALILVWLLMAVLTVAFEDRRMIRLAPSLGFVLLWSLGMGFYVYFVGALAGIDQHYPHHHNHPPMHHKQSEAPSPDAR